MIYNTHPLAQGVSFNNESIIRFATFFLLFRPVGHYSLRNLKKVPRVTSPLRLAPSPDKIPEPYHMILKSSLSHMRAI